MALRTGAVSDSAMTELLNSTSQRVDRKVQWCHGDRPVIAAMRIPGVALDLDVSADKNHITNTLGRAALDCGITESLTSHDIRRGPMRDLSKIDDSKMKKTVATFASASHLGHSRSAFASGATDVYTPNINSETWSKRLSIQEDEEDELFVLKPSSAPIKRKRQAQTTVDAALKGKGIDDMEMSPKTREKTRPTTAGHFRSAELADWRRGSKLDVMAGNVQIHDTS